MSNPMLLKPSVNLSNVIDLTIETIITISVITGALILGLLFQNQIIPKLRKRYARTQNANLRIFWGTIQGPINLIVVLGSIYGLGRYFKVEDNSIYGRVTQGSSILLIITFMYVIGKLVRNLLSYNIRKGRLPKTTIFNSLANIFIIIIAMMLVLISVGVNITPIIGALGIGGLAVALALQETLANLFAGISIIASKQINPGDFVQLNVTDSGYIEDIQWRTTSIRTVQNNLIIIPNSQLSNLTITNFSLPQPEFSLPIPVGVHYDSDLDHVRDICLEIANEIQQNEEGAVRDFEPAIRFRQFGPSSIDLNVVLRINEFSQQHHIRSEFIRKLRKRFHQEGIIIPYPITTVEFADKSKKFTDKYDFQ